METPRNLLGWLWLRLLEMGDVESELAISCNQARLPVQGWGYQPTVKISDPELFLCKSTKMEKR